MKGFTLIEILVVIFVIIIILVSLFFTYINPFEIFKEIRDQQRIKDLEVLSSAILNYIKNNDDLDLDGEKYVLSGKDEEVPTIYVSLPFDKNVLSFSTITSDDGIIWSIKYNASSTNLRLTNGEGWLPINLAENTALIPSLPVDPLNIVSSDNRKNYFYSYVFKRSTNEFEINANLESKKFKKGGSNDITSFDNGSDLEILESGNNKCLISYGNRTPNLYGTTTTSTCSTYNLQSGILKGEFSSQDLCWNKNFFNNSNTFYQINFIFKDINNNILIFAKDIFSNLSSFFVLKLNKKGNIIETKSLTINTTTPILLSNIYQSKDKNFYITYRINATTTYPGDSSLIKIDKNFSNVLWAKHYYQAGLQYPVYVYESPGDQKIELIQQVGYSGSFQSLKIDPTNGNLLPSNFIYQIPFGKIYTGIKTFDGGFILVGDEEDNGIPPLFLSAILIKFDKNNNIQWKKKYLNYGFVSSTKELPHKDIFILNTTDNGYIFTTLYKYNINENEKIKKLSFIKTNYLGEIEWIKEYIGGYDSIQIRDIKGLNNSDFVLIATIASSSNLFLFDKYFNIKKSYKFLTSEKDSFFIQKLLIDKNFYLLFSDFYDNEPFYSLNKKKYRNFNLLNEAVATIFTTPNIIRKYLNSIKLKNFDNLYHLGGNIFSITTQNIDFVAGTTSIAESMIVPTTTYSTPTVYDLPTIISDISINSIDVVNQCDIYWSKLVGRNIVINDLKKIDDGYLVAGYKLVGENKSHFWVAKFSTSGNEIISNHFRESDYNNILTKIIKNNYGNYIVLGYYYPYGPINFPNGYISELESDFTKKIEATSSNIMFSDIIELIEGIDNKYTVIGSKYENDYTPSKGYLAVYSGDFSVLQSFTDTINTNFNSVIYDSGYLYVAGENNEQGYLRRFSASDINKEEYWWSKKYDIYKDMKQNIKKIIFDENKNIIALFSIFDSNLGIYKVGLAKISPLNGYLIESRVVYNDYFFAKDILLTEDGNFLITGYLPLKKDPFSNWSLGLMKVDKNFNIIWVKYFGGYAQDEVSFGSSVVEAYNAGYLVGGYNAASKQGWLLKVSYDGDCIRCGIFSFKDRVLYGFRNTLNYILSNIKSVLKLPLQ